ncbi:MAG: ATP-binding protein [Candidatus Electrothrix sp. AW5]|nr:ATP-binding protein [Candidatus Electrothrix gigas]MCI5196152.1 ATP-binding protein [Candidatus Electrothrix gigas]
MRIQTFFFTDKTMGWELQPLSLDQLTLLVGASGVGKTRILRSILDVRRIAKGASINGVSWYIEFLTTGGRQYTWEGAFEDKGFSAENIFGFDDEDEKEKPKIESERVYINDKLVIERNTDGIFFNGTKTVKLSKNESAVFLLREEEQIQEACQEFDKVIFDDNTSEIGRIAFDDEVEEKLEKYRSIKTIRDSSEDVKLKLYFTYKNQKEYFEDISQSFTDVFPYVEEIKIESIAQNIKRLKHLPFFLREMPFIQIKEKGIENWIPENRISSGMLKTLMHIAELYLCADSSLLLIDEFENSLGINCIDELTSSIVSAERNLQFIITSHHPYIINNIKPRDWKVITRKAGSVISHDASEFNFDKSKHKAFTQLINLDLYSEGVES